jgi:hypothetical protein
LGELAEWKEGCVIAHCHLGGRSARACRLLRAKGFDRVENLGGGIEAWSLTVDPDVPRYWPVAGRDSTSPRRGGEGWPSLRSPIRSIDGT